MLWQGVSQSLFHPIHMSFHYPSFLDSRLDLISTERGETEKKRCIYRVFFYYLPHSCLSINELLCIREKVR